MHKESIYLTYADHHNRRALTKEELRSYIMMYALFYDELFISDSQFNNNSAIRSLFSFNQNDKQKNIQSDLDPLIKAGCLRPLLRDTCATLEDLRIIQQAKGVEGVPSPEFIEFIYGLKPSIKPYSLDTVSKIFTSRVKTAFRSDEAGIKNLSPKGLDLFKNYIAVQNVLEWNEIRKWLKLRQKFGDINQTDYQIVDSLVGSHYSDNVPISLSSEFDLTLSEKQENYPCTIRFGKPDNIASEVVTSNQELKPSIILNKEFLTKIPADLIIAIRKRDSRKALMKTMGQFRKTGYLDIDTFLNQTETFLADTDLFVSANLSKELKVFYDDWQKNTNNTKTWTTIRYIATSALTLIGILCGDPVLAQRVGAYDLIMAAYGQIHDIRASKRDFSVQQAFVAGKSCELEKLLLKIEK